MTPREPQEEPRLRITDKRRFANAAQESVPGSHQEPGTPSAETESERKEAPPASDVDSARTEAKEYLDHLRRLQAEFDNYRKRVQRELQEARELGAAPVLMRLLEVLDDFDLALMAAAEKPDLDRFLHGVELVYSKFTDALKAEGLERMEVQGKPFDPEQHEALMQTGDGDGDPMVADVLRPGYTLKGRVLRPAGVRVERD
ncbi:MAG: molecular chaperone GrpE [Actinomycetota bacterium]|nr:molecular chaperone GrpE [Actinomycetota bacterium]